MQRRDAMKADAVGRRRLIPRIVARPDDGHIDRREISTRHVAQRDAPRTVTAERLDATVP
jgi:hypothetical protein